MPELPEVETICNLLRSGSDQQPAILGKKIREGKLYWDRTLAVPDVDTFVERIKNQYIAGIDRRGKYIIFDLTDDYLLIHLRMSGDLRVDESGVDVKTHTRLLLELENGLVLAFIDPRKFGRVWLVHDLQDVLANLGPEPFDSDLNWQSFYQRLHSTKRQLKPLLLDQSFLAGLGNIYVDEALNLAHLHPLKRSNDITAQQAEILLVSIRQVLDEGIRRNGASIDWVYRGGDFQNYFRVYQRTGMPCQSCGTLIERIVIGQRGTHYCPQCQVMN